MVNNLLQALFPQACVLCGLNSSRTIPLCNACQACLARNTNSCGCCALPLNIAPKENSCPLCPGCMLATPDFDRVIAPWIYDEFLAALVHRWKFRREARLAALMAELWLIEHGRGPTVDIILPVPLHWTRLLQRGFNQSEMFAYELRRRDSSLRTVRLEPALASRLRNTGSQADLCWADRQSNMRAAFTIRRSCRGLRIAIVDDVMTTGSTVAALAAALRIAGANYIEVWCLARTPSPKA